MKTSPRYYVDLVMLVDDNEIDTFISERVVEMSKFAKRSKVYVSGREALEDLFVNQQNIKEIPELIFLDINMPVVNAFVFMSEFEKLEEQAKNKCRFVILSSSDNRHDIDKILENKYIIGLFPKPLDVKILEEVKVIMGTSRVYQQ